MLWIPAIGCEPRISAQFRMRLLIDILRRAPSSSICAVNIGLSILVKSAIQVWRYFDTLISFKSWLALLL
jgi:hypothetical protein